MAEYISSESVLDKLKDFSGNPLPGQSKVTVASVRLMLATADKVSVVHCRDCAHVQRTERGFFCKVWGMYNVYGGDGFCNYGE